MANELSILAIIDDERGGKKESLSLSRGVSSTSQDFFPSQNDSLHKYGHPDHRQRKALASSGCQDVGAGKNGRARAEGGLRALQMNGQAGVDLDREVLSFTPTHVSTTQDAVETAFGKVELSESALIRVASRTNQVAAFLSRR